MGKFKRASLEGGSEELFRPTRPKQERRERPDPDQAIDDIVEPRPVVGRPRLKAVHLSPDEIQLLIQAVQIAKYPERVKSQKLPLYEHERYDALRAKLQDAL